MSQIKILYWFVEYPWVIGLIIPLIIVMTIFVMWNAGKSKGKGRLPLIISRTVLFALLLIALASPYVQDETVVQGDPFVKIMMDNSTSYNLFDRKSAENTIATLKNLIEVEEKTIGYEEISALGDDVLGNLEKDESVLLVTDGNNNHGSSLGDVALHAARLNSTLNALRVEPLQDDSSIYIVGPEKAIEGIDTTFRVKVDKTIPDKGNHITVLLDDEVVYDVITKDTMIEVTRQFEGGYHTLQAMIGTDDFEKRNNIFYKVVKVIKKPKVVLYTEKDSRLNELLSKVYEVTPTTTLDELSNDYQALVIDDLSAEKLDPNVNRIRDFVADGNGLFVVGGKNSYDYGNYKESLIQGLLPVDIGTGEKKDEKVNIVIVLDISKSVGDTYGAGSAEDVEKALALSVIDNLNDASQVGVIAFNTRAYVVSEMLPLAGRKEELKSKISSLINIGNTHIPVGLGRGIQMLETSPGGKNIVVISDGKSGGVSQSQTLAMEAAEKGMKVYAISVGYDNPDDDQNALYGDGYLQSIARAGKGVWFKGEETPQKVKAIFGEHTEGDARDSYQAIVLDEDHFITQDLEISALVTGFNQVLPKASSRVLITLDSGEPIMTVWRFGLGRIVAFSTDSGNEWSGDFYSADNSIALTRGLNWVIGDPERGVKEYIDIKDGRINETTEIIVKTPKPPEDEDIVFYKIGDDLYSATIQTDSLGFHERFGAKYAVNYKAEYEEVNFNEELEKIVQSTGGKVFETNDISGIAEAISTQNRRVIEKKTYLRWPFIIAALVWYLIEVCIRRIAENRKK